MHRPIWLTFAFFFCVAPLLYAASQQAQDYDEQGLALYDQGLYAKAADYFQNAVQVDPSDWQGYQNLGNAYAKLGDKANALASYQKSLDLNPNNPTVSLLVDNLKSQGIAASETTVMQDQTNVESEEPIEDNNDHIDEPGTVQKTVVVKTKRPRTWRRVPPQPEARYTDGLNPIDHSKYWAKVEAGYTYATQGDFTASAAAVNSEAANGGLPFGFDTGNALFSTTSFHMGFEVGLLIDTHNGIAFGARYLQGSDYILDMSNSAASTISGEPSDFESANFTPYAVPITLDYYFFIPDAGGRFYLSAGLGYYVSTVKVDETYSLSNYYGGAGYYNTPFGDLVSGAFGFQGSIGREFAVNDRFSIDVFVRGRYAKITNYTGVLSDGNRYGLLRYSDGSIDIDNPALVGTAGTQYATVDFTGFDIGVAFCWYSF